MSSKANKEVLTNPVSNVAVSFSADDLLKNGFTELFVQGDQSYIIQIIYYYFIYKGFNVLYSNNKYLILI